MVDMTARDGWTCYTPRRDVLDAADGCHYGDYREANSQSANSRIRRHLHVMK
jgi:hypothetical protein